MILELLVGCVTGLDNDGETCWIIELKCTGSAKIKELERMIGHQHDIVRADVAMKKVHPVHLVDCAQERNRQIAEFLVRHDSIFFNKFLKRDAVQKFHDDIRGVVRLKKIVYLYDLRDNRAFCQKLCFVQKPVSPPGKGIHINISRYRHVHRIRDVAGGESSRIIFFYGNRALHNVCRPIGDTKSAFAEFLIDPVFAQQ